MSLYLIVFLILLVFSVYEYRKKKTQKLLYWIAFIILTSMLVLRYGQGTDYLAYYYYFLNTPTIWQLPELLASDVHGEPGWLFISAVFRGFNIPFHALIVLSALLTMCGLHRFLSRHSSMMTVSLLLAYPTIYLTYAMSAVRQAIVLTVFLGFLLDWLYEKKYIRYIVVTALCALIHSSALVFLVLFAVKKITFNAKYSLLIMAVCAVLGVCSSRLLSSLSDTFAYYAKDGFNILSLGERMISAFIVVFVFRHTLNSKETAGSSKLMFLLQIYLYGSFIYCFLAWSAVLSSRFAVYFKAVELVLFIYALLSDITVGIPVRIAGRLHLQKVKPVSVRHIVACYLFGLVLLMYFKNIASYIGQRGYYDFVNVFNYPYISWFNTELLEKVMTIPYGLGAFLAQ